MSGSQRRRSVSGNAARRRFLFGPDSAPEGEAI